MDRSELLGVIKLWFTTRYKMFERFDSTYSIYLYDDPYNLADIRVEKNDGWIFYSYSFLKEFKQIFPMISDKEFEIQLLSWATNTFELDKTFGGKVRVQIGSSKWLSLPKNMKI